jgi:hypothetical protein
MRGEAARTKAIVIVLTVAAIAALIILGNPWLLTSL